VSFQDGSPLPRERLVHSRLEIRAEVATRSGGRRNLDYQELKMSAEKLGVWEMKVDLRTQLGKSLSFPQHRKRVTRKSLTYTFRIHSRDLYSFRTCHFLVRLFPF
jgi:hypothetical protein